MSFILKALKKLEEEKSAAHRPGADLKSILMTSPHSKSNRRSPLLVLLFVLVTFVSGSALTWLLVRREAVETPTPVPPAQQPPAAMAAPAPALLPPEPAAQQEPHVTPPPNRIRAATATTAPAAPEAVVREQPRYNLQEVAPPPGVSLNGIAVRDDPADSVAIVNGIMLKRGMVSPGGVTVEEILPDKVRFSANGGTFELQLPR